MTNEQLIGQGGNDELLPLLWEKMRKLYIGWSGSFYNAQASRSLHTSSSSGLFLRGIMISQK